MVNDGWGGGRACCFDAARQADNFIFCVHGSMTHKSPLICQAAGRTKLNGSGGK